jgi:predicted nucleic acid-binding protein
MTIAQVAASGLSSGVIYDALLIAAAQKVGAERLLTFNLKHFLQVWPEGAGIIASP